MDGTIVLIFVAFAGWLVWQQFRSINSNEPPASKPVYRPRPRETVREYEAPAPEMSELEREMLKAYRRTNYEATTGFKIKRSIKNFLLDAFRPPG